MAFIDGTFAPAKKGALPWAKPSGARGSKVMAVADASGLPVAVHVASASPHEVTLVEQTLDAGFTNGVRARLIGHKAYDNDGLDGKLRKDWGTEMTAPHRRGR